MERNNFYLVKGNIDVVREYLENIGFGERIIAEDNNYGCIIIATEKKLFWRVKNQDVRTVKSLIVSKCQEPYTELSFEEFKKEYDFFA